MSKSAPLRIPRLKQVFVFLVCTAVGAGLTAVAWTGPLRRDKQRLTVRPSDLNLGAVWEQPALKFSLPIHNPTNRDVVVNRLSGSRNCTSLDPVSFTVPARGSLSVQGTIDLVMDVDRSGWPEDPFNVFLTAELGGAGGRIMWPLRGTVKRAVDVFPAAIALQGANEVIAGVYAPTVTLQVQPRLPLRSIKADFSPEEADVDLDGPTPEGGYQLHYAPRADLPRGDFDSRIILRTRLSDGSKGPEVVVPVHGFVSGPVRLSPSRLTLQPTRNAEAHPRTVVTASIVAADDAEWSIRGFAQVPEWLELDVDESRRVLRASLNGAPKAVRNATVEVHVQSADGRMEEVPLPLTVLPLFSTDSKVKGTQGGKQ